MLKRVISMPGLSCLVIFNALSVVSGQSTNTEGHRIVPVRQMSQDVEILYGDPERAGAPFVMRIRRNAHP